MQQHNFRAQYIYAELETVKNSNTYSDSDKEEILSVLKKLPMYVLTNGLAQTLSFLLSKKNSDKTATKISMSFVVDTLRGGFKLAGFGDYKNNEQFLNEVFKLDSANYMLWTDEALILANWLKTIAVILLEKKG